MAALRRSRLSHFGYRKFLLDFRFGSAKDYLATILVADGITSSVR
jgi:hypothetical protein